MSEKLRGNLPEATASRQLADELAAMKQPDKPASKLKSTVHNVDESGTPEASVKTELEPTGEINVGDIVLHRDEDNARYEVAWVGPSLMSNRIDVQVDPLDGDGKGFTLGEIDLLDELQTPDAAWSRG
jgi:hypothetical protein